MQHIEYSGPDEVSGITCDEFKRDYLSRNRPLVIRGGISQWPAIKRWSPDYLEQTVGYHSVDVETSSLQFNGKLFIDAEKVQMTFGEFLRRMDQPNGIHDYFVGSWLFPTIVPDVLALDLEQAFALFYKRRLLMARGGNRIALHYDWYENLLCQVAGRKRITMIDSSDTDFLYQVIHSESPNYSPVDVDNVDWDEYPCFKKAQPTVVDLYPGDVLYIPTQYWHAVSSYDWNVAVSVGFYEGNSELLTVLSKLITGATPAIKEPVLSEVSAILHSDRDDREKLKQLHRLAASTGNEVLQQKLVHRGMLFS